MSPMVRLPLTVEHALLGFLRQQPMHGYEIYQHLTDPVGLGLVWRLKQSQLYALLGKLEREGYIESTLEPQALRPPRKVFHLTAAGQDAFRGWVRAPVEHGRALRLEFLTKLFFAQEEGPAAVQQLLARQRAACERWLAAQARERAALPAQHAYEALVYQFRRGQIEAMLGWLDQCEQSLLVPSSEP